RYGRKSADRISTVRAFAFPSRRAGLRARTRSFSRCAPYRWYAAPRTLGGGGSHGNGPDKFPMELYPSLWADEPPPALPCFLSHPNDHDNRSFSSSSALAASARAPAWERLAGPESTPEPRWRTYSSPDF